MTTHLPLSQYTLTLARAPLHPPPHLPLPLHLPHHLRYELSPHTPFMQSSYIKTQTETKAILGPFPQILQLF